MHNIIKTVVVALMLASTAVPVAATEDRFSFNRADTFMGYFDPNEARMRGHVIGGTYVAGFFFPAGSDDNVFAHLNSPAVYMHSHDFPICLWDIMQPVGDVIVVTCKEIVVTRKEDEVYRTKVMPSFKSYF